MLYTPPDISCSKVIKSSSYPIENDEIHIFHIASKYIGSLVKIVSYNLSAEMFVNHGIRASRN